MRRSAFQIYALAVCFATLMCFVVCLGIGLYDVVRMAVPGFTLSGWQVYESNSRFALYWPDKKDLPDDELTHVREAAYNDALAGERHIAAQSAVFVAIILLIDIAVYVVHWRLARTASEQKGALAPANT